MKIENIILAGILRSKGYNENLEDILCANEYDNMVFDDNIYNDYWQSVSEAAEIIENFEYNNIWK